MSPVVLVTATRFDEFCSDSLAELRDFGCEVILNAYDRPYTFQELQPHLARIDAVIAGVDTWDEQVFAAAPSLKVLTRFGVGVDNFDLTAANGHGIQVGNVPGGNARAVAELTLASILTLLRDVNDLHRATQRAEWPRTVGRELTGRTVGILGFGSIGTHVAQLLGPFDCRLLGYDAFPDQARMEELGVINTAAEDVAAEADILLVHLPALPETHHFVDAEFLGSCKPGAIVINMARGSLVDSHALRAAVDSGHIAAAAVDVYEAEPVQRDDPLLGSPRILTFPHTAAETEESYARIGQVCSRAVIDALSGRRIAHAL